MLQLASTSSEPQLQSAADAVQEVAFDFAWDFLYLFVVTDIKDTDDFPAVHSIRGWSFTGVKKARVWTGAFSTNTGVKV